MYYTIPCLKAEIFDLGFELCGEKIGTRGMYPLINVKNRVIGVELQTLHLFISVLLLALSQSIAAIGQSAKTDSLIQLNGLEGKFEVLTDGIYPNKDPHFGKGLLPLPDYYNWKRKISAKWGLDYVLTLSPIFQYVPKNGNTTGNVENDLIGNWRIIENEKSKANISFWFLHAYNFTELTTSDFSKQEGLTLETNLGDIPYQNYVSIMALWWEQSFIEKKLLFRIGHINSNMVWGNNTYINDDRHSFMNTVSSSQQGTSWVGNRSLGFQVSYFESQYYIAGGFQDANSDQRYPDFSALFDGPVTLHFEMGWTPTFTTGSGKYSLTVSSVQNPDGAYNYSFLLNMRQEIIKGKLGVFTRFGTQSKAVSTPVKSALTTGVYVNNVFDYSSDAVGLAYVNAKSVDSASDRDQGFEVFYRMLLTDRLDATLDAQYFFEVSNSNVGANTLVSSIRLRFIL